MTVSSTAHSVAERCRLCLDSSAPLRKSHVLPAFIYRWMKATGTKYLRGGKYPNRRVQDGPQERWLCGACETRFNGYETWFANTVFHPYVQRRQYTFTYDERLYRFALSVLWRTLLQVCELGDVSTTHMGLAQRQLERWRAHLAADVIEDVGEVHMFLTDIGGTDGTGSIPVENWNRYISQGTDCTVAESSNSAIVYTKLGRFIFFGELTRVDDAWFSNTRVHHARGTYTTRGCVLGPSLGEFLVDRARSSFERVERVLTNEQRASIATEIHKNADAFMRSDMAAALHADFTSKVEPLSAATSRKIGRNEPCPCNSGLKFKKCHGSAQRDPR